MRIKSQESRVKGLVLIVAFLVTCFLSLVTTTEAHILKTDGSIGAVLHIDPDDDPVAGEQSGFFFEFKDKQGKFKPQNCDCTFQIIEDGKEIFSETLFQNNQDPSLQNASLFFTFPEKNVYQVKVIGKPILPDAFQPFTLTYDIRVAKVAYNQTTSQNATQNFFLQGWLSKHIIHLIGGFIVLGFLIFALIRQKFNKQSNV